RGGVPARRGRRGDPLDQGAEGGAGWVRGVMSESGRRGAPLDGWREAPVVPRTDRIRKHVEVGCEVGGDRWLRIWRALACAAISSRMYHVRAPFCGHARRKIDGAMFFWYILWRGRGGSRRVGSRRPS